jgi:site-specific DNA-cytosine methylase
VLSILTTTFKQRRDLVQGEDEISHTLCGRDFREPRCVVVGKLGGEKWSKMFQMSRVVLSPDGVSGALHTCGGGNTEPKIIAIRGRNPENPSYRTRGVNLVQVAEENKHGTANTITTVQKDNLVLEGDADFITRGIKRFVDKNGYLPELINPYNSREITDTTQTLTGECGSKTSSSAVLNTEIRTGEYFRIRKLTPKECWRLMGWKDEQIDKVIACGMSNAQM